MAEGGVDHTLDRATVLTPYGKGTLLEERSSDGILVVQLSFGVAYLNSASINHEDKTPKRTWAPLNVPLQRRRQTFALVVWIIFPWICLAATIFLLRQNGIIFYAMLLYLSWIALFQSYPRRGGCRQKWVRELAIWSWFRDYFPITLHKTAELKTDQSYIFGYHPHGIISMGAFINFATEATGFSRLFPGITCHLLTLATNFRIPFYGFYLGALGVCDVGAESIRHILSKGNGNSVMIVIGGAKESLDAHPSTYQLTLRERRGFVRMALENGSSLVPVIGFGENDIFDQVANPPGSKLRLLQRKMQKKLGFAIPLVKGRGIFNYYFGLLPQRKPIHTVVGKPIAVPKTPSNAITPDLVQRYHNEYINAVKDLFEQYKWFHPSSIHAEIGFSED